MYFKLHTNKIQVDIETKEKYVFIQGFSGAGKSLFIEEVERLSNLENMDVYSLDSDLDIVVVNKGIIKNMQGIISNDRPVLFITDEFYACKVVTAIQGRNAACIAVTRKIPKNINFSYKCLYYAHKVNGITCIHERISISDKQINTEFNTVLVEDEKCGYEYFDKVLDNVTVKSSHGKGNVSSIVRDWRENKRYDNFILIVDGAGIGSDIIAIRRECQKFKKAGGKFAMCLPECFEELLVNSELLKSLEKKVFRYIDNNLESFYENEIERLTSGLPMEYNHEKQYLSTCWYENCCNCERVCKFAVNHGKATVVLANSKCSSLLVLCRRDLI